MVLDETNRLTGDEIKERSMAARRQAFATLQEKIPESTGWLKAVPENSKRLYAESLLGEASPREAIKAKCQECCGYEDMSERIVNCRVMRCPLRAYRPYQGPEEP